MNDLFTIGYQGQDLDTVVARLRSAGVQTLVDVRELPLSRKKGFSKTPLRERLEADDMTYAHLRDLGAPKALRDPYKAGGSHEAFVAGYRAHLDKHRAAYLELLELMEAGPVAILCFEADPTACHRGVIAEKVAEEGIAVAHL